MPEEEYVTFGSLYSRDDGSKTLKKLKAYSKKTDEEIVKKLLGFIDDIMVPTTSKNVFDLSKPISSKELGLIANQAILLPDKIKKKEDELRAAEASVPPYGPDYIVTANIEALQEKYLKKSKHTLFSSARKLEKLKQTPEYQEEYLAAKLADEAETKKYQRQKKEAEQKISALRSELEKMKEDERFYRPLYDRCIFWGQKVRSLIGYEILPRTSNLTLASDVSVTLHFNIRAYPDDLPDKLFEQATMETAQTKIDINKIL